MKNFELNSVIINGIRFDAVKDKGGSCYECSLFFNDGCTLQGGGRVCRSLYSKNQINNLNYKLEMGL